MNHIACIGLCALMAIGAAGTASPKGMNTIGLYAFQPNASQYKFWRACGYNTLEFTEHSFSEPVERRDEVQRRFANGIVEAKRAGFKVWVILLSNINEYPDYSSVPAFDPSDERALQHRIDAIAKAVKACHEADGFTFFGGDPGGSPRSLGADGVPTWVKMARTVHDIVKREAPKAGFDANIWATTAWEYMSINPFKAEFWQKEVSYGKQIVDEKDFIGRDCGIEFPMHNYYRSLALKAYDAENLTPELYPTSEEIAKLKARGTKRMWTWAHFLIDEVDDGYTGYSGAKTHPAQAETRYLHKIVTDSRKIGLNGVISNTSGDDSIIEQMNVYAFARFAVDPSLTPGKVIDDYAGYLADDRTKGSLGQVLRFIENHSTWETSIPAKYHLPPFECSLKSAGDALSALAEVRPLSNPTFPVPEAPSAYLTRLHDRLTDIAAATK